MPKIAKATQVPLPLSQAACSQPRVSGGGRAPPHPLDGEVLAFGKYKGRPFKDVRRSCKGYCSWALQQEAPNGGLRQFVDFLREKDAGVWDAGKYTEGTQGRTVITAAPRTAPSGPPHPLDDTQFTFGKHKGATYRGVYDTDRGYSDWAVAQASADGPLGRFIEYSRELAAGKWDAAKYGGTGWAQGRPGACAPPANGGGPAAAQGAMVSPFAEEVRCAHPDDCICCEDPNSDANDTPKARAAPPPPPPPLPSVDLPPLPGADVAKAPPPPPAAAAWKMEAAVAAAVVDALLATTSSRGGGHARGRAHYRALHCDDCQRPDRHEFVDGIEYCAFFCTYECHNCMRRRGWRTWAGIGYRRGDMALEDEEAWADMMPECRDCASSSAVRVEDWQPLRRGMGNRDRGRPHESAFCEACRQGICRGYD